MLTIKPTQKPSRFCFFTLSSRVSIFIIKCVEEIAYRMGYIDAAQVARLAAPLEKSGYGEYLMQVVAERPGF